MITSLFLNVFAISISTSLIIVFLIIFAPFLNKRYAIKWKYLMWIVIAFRLIIPFNMDIPLPRMVIDVPTEITVPIDTNKENNVPTISPIEQNPIEVNYENAVQAPLQTAPQPFKPTLLDIAAYLWLTGCLLFLLVHIFSFLHYKGQVIKKGKAVKERYVLQQVDQLSKKLRMKPNVRILRYKGAESPMVIGFLKPVLVLPDCVYLEEELFFILKHELIHIKRHDIYFKLLFVTANALHWFNPLIYIMQKEAAVDMELSCDEKVIQQTSYEARKAYTETLLSTFGKQHKKGTFFTTQFYGGKKIMKKRFKNILTKSPKKNGLLVCICIICITFISGALIGCSATKNNLLQEPAEIENHSPEGSAEIENDLSEEPTKTDLDLTNPSQENNTQSDTLDADTTTGDSGTQNDAIENPPEQPLTSGENNYKSILLGESSFICTDLANIRLNISEIKQVVSDEDWVTASVTKFAVVDLDGDGEAEVVLWIYVNGGSDFGFEILDDQNGEIYGYTLWYRAFMDLKTDGTFLFSSGAADFGIGKMNFFENGYSVSGQAYSQSGYDSNNELIVQYYVNGESCSQDEFNEAVNGQEQKADVEWYDLSESAVNAVL